MFFSRLIEKRMLQQERERTNRERLKTNLIKDAADEVIDETAAMMMRYCPIKQSNCPGAEDECIFFQPGHVGRYYEGSIELGLKPYVHRWHPRCKLEAE